MKDNDLHDKIDRYLDGQMPEAERQIFEQEISENPFWVEEVKKHRLEREAVQLLLTNDYSLKIKAWSTPVFEKIQEEENVRFWIIFRIYSYRNRYAAALAGILIVASLFLWSQLRFSNSAIYTQNFIDPGADLLDSGKGSGIDMSITDSVELLLDQVKMAYKNKQYAEGIRLLEIESSFFDQGIWMGDSSGTVRLNGQTLTESTAYLLGHLYLAQKEYDKAIDWFHRVSAMNASHRQKAEYYSLLAMLGNKQTNAEFYRLLNTIAATSPAHPYQHQAVNIQKSLQSFWRRMIWQ